MSKQVFWGIPSLTDQVLKINGTTVSSIVRCEDLPAVDSSYEVLEDDGGIMVLVVTTSTQISIETPNGNFLSAVADFIGEKPRRPK